MKTKQRGSKKLGKRRKNQEKVIFFQLGTYQLISLKKKEIIEISFLMGSYMVYKGLMYLSFFHYYPLYLWIMSQHLILNKMWIDNTLLLQNQIEWEEKEEIKETCRKIWSFDIERESEPNQSRHEWPYKDWLSSKLNQDVITYDQYCHVWADNWDHKTTCFNQAF